MQIVHGNLLNSLRGTQAFLDEHAGVLGTIPQSGARQTLDTQVTEMTAHAAAQDTSHRDAKDATQTQYQLRQAVVRGHMAPIARIAASVLPPGPALTALTLPKSAISTPQLHAAAIGMAKSAEPNAAVFTAAGLPDDFLTQLRNAADQLLVPIDSRTRSRNVRKGATETMKVQASNARKTVRVIDALMQNQLANDPDLLTQWNGVKRPSAKTGKVGTTAPAAPTTSAAPATPAIPAAPAANVP